MAKKKSSGQFYFVGGYSQIDRFLSLCEPGEGHTIFVSYDLDLTQFIRECYPSDTVVTVPYIPKFYCRPPTTRHFFKRLVYFMFIRFQAADWTNAIRKDSCAFIQNTIGIPAFHIILGFLKKKGVKIKYFGGSKPTVPFTVIPFQSRKEKIGIAILNKVAGIPLSQIKYDLHDKWAFAMANQPENQHLKAKSWKDISEKFNLTNQMLGTNTVLVIDSPVRTQPYKFEREQTIVNFELFLQKLLSSKKIIHFKPHCRFPFDHTLLNSSLKNKVTILPHYRPVELIIQNYSEVYGVLSTSLGAPIAGKKYRLKIFSKMAPAEEERLDKHLKHVWGKDHENVKVIDCISKDLSVKHHTESQPQ